MSPLPELEACRPAVMSEPRPAPQVSPSQGRAHPPARPLGRSLPGPLSLSRPGGSVPGGMSEAGPAPQGAPSQGEGSTSCPSPSP